MCVIGGVGITMPCAAFVVSAVQEALGGRGGPTPKGGTSRTAAGNGEMEEKMFCTKCGKPLDDAAAFCPSCGSRIADNAPHQAAPTQAANDVPYQVPYQAAPPKAAKKRSKAKIVLIAVVVIIAILVYIFKNLQHTLEGSLSGTWIAPFADGAGECRLHFDEDADQGSAMLLRFDENGDAVGYFEVIYAGDVTYTSKDEGGGLTSGVISMENVSNTEKQEHAFELSYITISYAFDPSTGQLILESDFLSDYFSGVDTMVFRSAADDAYYSETGDRYYDWNLFS